MFKESKLLMKTDGIREQNSHFLHVLDRSCGVLNTLHLVKLWEPSDLRTNMSWVFLHYVQYSNKESFSH